MKNALVAFDKFKDALTALQACQCAAQALAAAQPNWKIALSPLADGGDGFCDTLTRLCQGRFYESTVSSPLGQPTRAAYGLVETASISPSAATLLQLPARCETLAIVEFAQSSGIALVPAAQRSPWTTTSYGLGQCIAHAQQQGAEAILIGLGGSATNDLALGSLQALGYQFLDANRNPIADAVTPEKWKAIASIQPLDTAFPLPVRIACDVENPLLGPNGATAIFGPQKGLLPADYSKLESEMKRLATSLCLALETEIQTMDTPGAGAAGGAAFGLMTGLGGKLVPGAELVFEWSSLHHKLADADLVITGEGRFDASSLQGKGPGALAKLCIHQGKDLLVLAGSVGALPEPAIAALAHAISPPNLSLPEALAATESNLRRAIEVRFSN